MSLIDGWKSLEEFSPSGRGTIVKAWMCCNINGNNLSAPRRPHKKEHLTLITMGKGIRSPGWKPDKAERLLMKLCGLSNLAMFRKRNTFAGKLTAAIERDRRRFETDEWKPVTWLFYAPQWEVKSTGLLRSFLGEPMFLHRSVKNPEHVAYYQNIDKFLRDIQTTTSYGKLLKKMYPDMPDDKIKNAVEQHLESVTEYKLHIGDTQEDFIHTIADGPSDSCMAKNNLRYKGHIHPAAVYAAGDIEVLWLEDSKGKVISRLLANKKTKHCTRIYGDNGRMRGAIASTDYRQERNALAGCKLLCIPDKNDNGWIMPYVDAGVTGGGGSLYAEMYSSEGDYWLLNNDDFGINTFVGYDRDGVVDYVSEEDNEDDNGDYVACPMCNEAVPGDTMVNSPHGELCYDCAQYYCWDDHEDEWIPEDEAVELNNGRRTHEDNTRFDELDEEYILKSEVVTDDYGLICSETCNSAAGNALHHGACFRLYCSDASTYEIGWNDLFHPDALVADKVETLYALLDKTIRFPKDAVSILLPNENSSRPHKRTFSDMLAGILNMYLDVDDETDAALYEALVCFVSELYPNMLRPEDKIIKPLTVADAPSSGHTLEGWNNRFDDLYLVESCPELANSHPDDQLLAQLAA